jgi:hypothetical protein
VVDEHPEQLRSGQRETRTGEEQQSKTDDVENPSPGQLGDQSLTGRQRGWFVPDQGRHTFTVLASRDVVHDTCATDRATPGWRDCRFRGGAGDGPQINKTFEAPDGSLRLLSAGNGSELVFTNLDTGATYSLAAKGARRRGPEWTPADQLVLR